MSGVKKFGNQTNLWKVFHNHWKTETETETDKDSRRFFTHKFNGQPRCMGTISFMVCRCAYLGCIYQYSGMMYFLLRKRTAFQHISMPHIRNTVYTYTSTTECKIRSKNFISLFRDPLAEPKGNHSVQLLLAIKATLLVLSRFFPIFWESEVNG